MNGYTKILIDIPRDLDFEINVHLARLRSEGIKTTKADEILRLAKKGLTARGVGERSFHFSLKNLFSPGFNNHGNGNKGK